MGLGPRHLMTLGGARIGRVSRKSVGVSSAGAVFWPAAIGCRAQARMIPLPRHALPTPRPAAFRPRRHGFPRSHGPAEDEVNGTWLTLRCCPDPRSSRVTRITSGPRCNEGGECRRNPRRAGILTRAGSRCGRRTWRDRALAATGSPVGDGARDVLSIPASAEPRVSLGRMT
jgi:hypothetical protein